MNSTTLKLETMVGDAMAELISLRVVSVDSQISTRVQMLLATIVLHVNLTIVINVFNTVSTLIIYTRNQTRNGLGHTCMKDKK